jgi:hypothetical protein
MARTQIGFWAVMRDFHTLTTLVLSSILYPAIPHSNGDPESSSVRTD